MKFVNHIETYGRHILYSFSKNLTITKCVDLGCGKGDDLQIIKRNSNAHLTGVDFNDYNYEVLKTNGIESFSIDIEKQKLPFENNSVDFVIANQVLEHTKEIFWINHEIFRILEIGGYLYIGVPNALAFHNRILGLIGFHPTCSKIISAHVRSFSKRDTIRFYKTISKDFTKLVKFKGSQFYPFPKFISRILSRIFPASAGSIFFLIQKTSEYNGEFIKWLNNASLETNYYNGEK